MGLTQATILPCLKSGAQINTLNTSMLPLLGISIYVPMSFNNVLVYGPVIIDVVEGVTIWFEGMKGAIHMLVLNIQCDQCTLALPFRDQ